MMFYVDCFARMYPSHNRTASSYDRSSRSIDLNHPSVKCEMFSESKSDGHLDLLGKTEG